MKVVAHMDQDAFHDWQHSLARNIPKCVIEDIGNIEKDLRGNGEKKFR